jgi:hypothetical protein
LKVSGVDHPGREEVLAAMEQDGSRVVREQILGPCDRPVLFLKQMAHHLVEVDLSFLDRTANVLLIRDPADVLRSLVHQIPQPTLRDTGLKMQSALLQDLRRRGQEPPVLDARQLLLDPEGVLGQLCDRLGIPFEAAMLRWPAGSQPEDGVWAPHWYASVHRSTGFQPHREKTEPVPDHLLALLEECRTHYDTIYSKALRARGKSASFAGEAEPLRGGRSR